MIRIQRPAVLPALGLAAALGLVPGSPPVRAAPPVLDRAVIGQLVDSRSYDALAARGRGVMPVLVELYRQADRDADREAKIRIADAFYRLGWRSREALEVLLPDARSSDENLRIEAQYALGRVSDDPVVVDVLIENLQRGFNPLVRDKAACGLAYDQIHLDDRQKARLFRKLIELLESPSAEIRSLAIRVLQVHTGQTKGYVPAVPEPYRAAALERWKRWIEEYEANL